MDNVTQQSTIWSFPEFSFTDGNISVNNTELYPEKNTPSEIDNLERAREIAFHKQESLQYKNELDELKITFEHQTAILQTLFNKLKNPLSILDEEIMELMLDIIKKIAKRIVCKEVAVDAQIIPAMIQELKNVMGEKNGLVAISLSTEDYARIEATRTDLTELAIIDKSLAVGDIILKSNYSEIRALLNERIEQLVRVEHE